MLRIPLLAGSAFLSALASPAAAQSWSCNRSPLVITNARLWNDSKPATKRELVIVDGQIQQLGGAGKVKRPAGSRIVDARNAWLLPGLIDSHVHFGRPPGVPQELLPKPYPGAWGTTGRQTLASGVTTVRIHYSDFEKGPRFAREARDDCNPSPAVLLGSGGLLGGKPSDDAWLTQIDGPDDARQKIRDVAAVGAKWLEMHDVRKFTPDEIKAIRNEGRESGVQFVSAGESFDDLRAGLAAGFSVIDHFDMSAASQYPADLIDELRRRNAFVIATLGFYSRYNAFRANPSLIDPQVIGRFETPAIADALYQATLERFRKPPPQEQNMVDDFAAYRSKFRQLLDSGVKMVVGTDSGSQGHFQTDAIWWEMRAWSEDGASTGQILAASTKLPAEMLGLEDRGELSVGKRGDFLIYDGDLEGGEWNLGRVRYVGRGGVLYVEDGKWVGPEPS